MLGLINQHLALLALIAALILVWKDNPWRRSAKIVATIGVFTLLGSVLPDSPDTGPAGARDRQDGTGQATSPVPTSAGTASPTPPAGPKAADHRGMGLSDAQDKAKAAGFSVGSHNASSDGKTIWAESMWTVCFQDADWAGHERKTIDFGAVQSGTPCPGTDGGAVPWPTMPHLTGKTWKMAKKALVAGGVVTEEDRVRADTAYGNDTLPDEGDHNDWRVCAVDPAEGADVTASSSVTLELTHPDHVCPGSGALKDGGVDLPDRDNDGDPDYLDPAPDDRSRNSTFPDGLDISGNATGGSGRGGSGWGSGGGRSCGRWC